MTNYVIPFSGYPIYKVSVNDLHTDDELNFIKSFKKKNIHSNITNNNGAKISENSHILNFSELHNIKELILKNFNDYINNVLEIENQFYMCNSWCGIQNKNNFHPRHAHPNAIFSCVYYLQSDNSSIIFTKDKSKIQEGFFFEYKIKKYNLYNSQEWNLPVKTGDMIFFPGELHHQTEKYEGENERIIVASSFFIKGQLGTSQSLNDINLG